MTLRTKSLLLLAIAIFSMMGALIYISQEIMQSGFGQVEEADAKENVGRIQDAMKAQVESLHTKLAAWAAWDDAYKYVQDNNAEFEKSNLNLASLQNMKLDLLAYFNDKRELVWGKTLNDDRSDLTDLTKELIDHLNGRDQIFNFKDETGALDGVVVISGQPWVMTAQPVVTSEQKGPIKGTLVGARRIDAAFIEKMSQVTHLDVAFVRFDDAAMSVDFAKALQAIGRTENTFISRPSDERISGYYVQFDAYASPALIMKMEKPRDINAQGVATPNIFLMALLVASILLGIAITILLERFVLKPPAPQPLLKIIEQLPERPAAEALSWLGDAATATANQIDKEIKKFEWLPSANIDPVPYKALFKSLIHLVRNAVDHGLEYPDERVQFGKPRGGRIQASLTREADMYTLRIKDDGHGIDLDKLREKAKKMGIPVPKSESELLNLIFADGFSTRDEVSTTSGRGVGLSAVRAEARNLGGDVVVNSVFGEGTEFVITFKKIGASVAAQERKLAA